MPPRLRLNMYIYVLLIIVSGAFACTENEKQCSSDNRSLPAEWWCDGQEDCQDGSDESNCDPCNSNPCMNNGTCFRTKFGFRCKCVDKFADAVCEKPICDPKEDRSRIPVSKINGGSTYVRWGRNTCPRHARLVYKGYAGGSKHTETGGGSNYICLPDRPSWSRYTDSANVWFGNVWGAEYEIHDLQSSVLSTTNTGGVSLHNNDVPCAVCQSTGRTSVLMIPGKTGCYSGWVQEYTGMLMSAYYAHKGRTEFVCMDTDPEIRPGGQADRDGVLFYLVKGKCGSLPCPPYVANRELACVVCTN